MTAPLLVGVQWRAGQLFELGRAVGARLGEILDEAGVELVIVRDEDSVVAGDRDDAKAASLLAASLPLLGTVAVAVSVDPSLAEPFNIARETATLDILTSGNAALVVRPSRQSTDPARLGILYREFDDTDELLRESIEVIRRLWDSWEPDAVARDWTTNRFVDASKVHRIDYHGRFLHVRGPAATPRSPQGVLPVIADLSGAATPPDPDDWPRWSRIVDLVIVDASLPRATPSERVDRPPRLLARAEWTPQWSDADAPAWASGIVVDCTALGEDESLTALESITARAGSAGRAASAGRPAGPLLTERLRSYA